MRTAFQWLTATKRALFMASAVFLLPACLHGETLLQGTSMGHDYRVNEVTNGLSTPWGLAFISDTELLVTEKQGRLWLVDAQTGERSAISGLPGDISTNGQGGLLDVQAGPEFSTNRTLYFTYSKSIGNGAATALARAVLADNNGSLIGWEDVLVTDSASPAGQHFGSRVTFDDQGHLYFGIGDRGNRDNGQDLSNHASAILRLHLDGRVPQDNPFVDDPQVPDEVWSLGHRNPQGLTYDSERGILWEIEHGPRGGDEINVIEPGENYGWPVVSHGREYWGPIDVGEAESLPGYVDPVKVYVPSIAPGSLWVYRGDAFPQWQGHLFAGALVLRHLNHVAVSESGTIGEEDRLLEDLEERIRAVTGDSNGHLFLTTDSGRILRVSPAR